MSEFRIMRPNSGSANFNPGSIRITYLMASNDIANPAKWQSTCTQGSMIVCDE